MKYGRRRSRRASSLTLGRFACARNMSETTTEVVEEVSSSSSISSAKLWQKWSITNLQGFLPFLPKVPAQKESVGLLQQLSPRAIKSECALTRHLLTSNLPGIPSTNQAGQTPRVQTIRAVASVSSPTVSSSPPTPKKNSADSILSISFASLALLTGLSNLCPEFLRRSQLTSQNESILTTLAVYSGLLILAIEGSGCLFGLVTGSMPPGLVFMVSALLLMMVIVCVTIGHDPNAPDQSILSPSPAQRTSQRNLRNER